MPKEASGYASVRWSWVAYAALLLAVTSMIITVSVLSVHNVDTLSSIALSLAILSFVTQFIVFAVQTQNSAAQLHASEETNAKTQATLVEIALKTSSIEKTVEGQMQEMFRWFMKQVPAAAREVEAKTGFSAAAVEGLIEAALSRTSPGGDESAADPARVLEDQQVLARIESGHLEHPEGEVEKSARSLSLGEKSIMLIYLADERRSRRHHTTVGIPPAYAGDSGHLEAIGLLAPAGYSRPTLAEWRRLTSLGVDVAVYGQKHGWVVDPNSTGGRMFATLARASRVGMPPEVRKALTTSRLQRVTGAPETADPKTQTPPKAKPNAPKDESN